MNPENVIAKRPHKTILREGNKCIKVFDSSYSKVDVLNEALNQARVEETGLNIPAVLEVGVTDGKWSITSEFIEGKTLERMMEEDPGSISEYIEKLADIQMDILSRRCPHLNRLKEKMHRKIAQAELDENTRYDLQTRLEGMPYHKKLCHGDLDPSNVIITPSGEAYILDWAHVTSGNASADAARTYLLFMLAGKEREANLYLDAFCGKNGIKKSYVQSWMPIVAASQSVKGKEEERAILLRWAGVVDYV